MHQDVKFDFTADLTGIGDRSVRVICDFFFFLMLMYKLQSTEDSSTWLVVRIRSAENGHSYQQGAGNVYTYIAVRLRM